MYTTDFFLIVTAETILKKTLNWNICFRMGYIVILNNFLGIPNVALLVSPMVPIIYSHCLFMYTLHSNSCTHHTPIHIHTTLPFMYAPHSHSCTHYAPIHVHTTLPFMYTLHSYSYARSQQWEWMIRSMAITIDRSMSSFNE